MSRYHIRADEWYSVYELTTNSHDGPEYDIPDALVARVAEVFERFWGVQEELASIADGGGWNENG